MPYQLLQAVHWRKEFADKGGRFLNLPGWLGSLMSCFEQKPRQMQPFDARFGLGAGRYAAARCAWRCPRCCSGCLTCVGRRLFPVAWPEGWWRILWSADGLTDVGNRASCFVIGLPWTTVRAALSCNMRCSASKLFALFEMSSVPLGSSFLGFRGLFNNTGVQAYVHSTEAAICRYSL